MVRHRRVVAPLLLALVASLCSLVGGVQPSVAANSVKKGGGGGGGGVVTQAQSLYNVGVTSAGPAGDGYWEVTDGGLVTALREAPNDPLPATYGDLSQGPFTNIVGIAGLPNGGGYWLAGRDGVVYPFGSAQDKGHPSVSNIIGIAAAPDAGGYWLVGADGGIFNYGSAPFKGSLGGQGYSDVVGMAATPSGQGYWLVRSNGAIYSFGDAVYHGGSPAGVNNIVGMAAIPSGGGYWLLGGDGGIFAYDAPYYGNGLGQLCCGFTYSAIVAKRNLHDGYRLIGKNTSDFPGFEPNKAPIGSITENSFTRVAACAVDPNTTTTAITMQIVADGVERFRQATSGDNAACAYSGISGNHGIDWAVGANAPDLQDGRQHTVVINALDSSTGTATEIGRSTWTAPNLDPVGVVQHAEGAKIAGWVHDPNSPTQPLTVKIYVDGAATPYQTVVANISQPNANPPVSDGFEWLVPDQFRDGKNHLLKVEALDYPSAAPIAITDSTLSFLQLADVWSGANGSPWSTAAWNTSSTSVDRIVDISGNQGRLYVAGPLKDAQAKQVVTSNNPALDSDTYLAYQFVNPGDSAKLKIAARGSDALAGSWMSEGYQAEIRSYSNVVKIYRVVSGVRTELGGFTYTPGTTWQSMRLRVTGTDPAIIKVKMWPKGSAEPTSWTKVVTDTTPVTIAGVFHVSLTNSGGTTARTALVDDLRYTRLQASNEPNPTTAPPNSVSRYLNFKNVPAGTEANLFSQGQAEGNRVKTNGYEPFVILMYGAQLANLDGATGYEGNDYTGQELVDSGASFADGYYSTNPGRELTLALGTNNSGFAREEPDGGESDAKRRGVAWAGFVNQIYDRVHTAHPNMEVFGAQDFEQGDAFGGPAPVGPRNAKAWVAGYDSAAHGHRYIEFGSADGCPTSGASNVPKPCPTGAPENHTGTKAWTQDDYVQLTQRVVSARGGLPQIYNIPATSQQWQQISSYGAQSANFFDVASSIDFLGALTQIGACSTRTCDPSVKTPPANAWTDFKSKLDADGRTSPSPSVSVG